MCLVSIAWKQSERYPLVIAANRDEYHARPTLPVREWDDAPGVFGGRDLRAGGGWLALSRDGRLAAVTNVREGQRVSTGTSRGLLVSEFLRRGAGAGAVAEAERRHAEAGQFGPYNLLLWDGRDLVHATNRPAASWQLLPPGLHGVSNGALNSPWPKLQRVAAALRHWLQQPASDSDPDVSSLLGALADVSVAPDAELPDTGVGLETERRLAPPFIRGAEYGTRASSVVLVGRDGRTLFVERNYDPGGVRTGEERIVLSMAAAME
jgi:uncharacterized protein with NRDE domain